LWETRRAADFWRAKKNGGPMIAIGPPQNQADR
jgi:hypothetical protein